MMTIIGLMVVIAAPVFGGESVLTLQEASSHMIQVTETVIYSDGTVTREITDYTQDADTFLKRISWHLSAQNAAAVRRLMPRIAALPEHVSEEGRLRLDPSWRSFEFMLDGRRCDSAFESYTDESLATPRTAQFTDLWHEVLAIVERDMEP